MMRWKITIEYDGSEFVGWQRQANGFSVQEALESAIAGFSGEEITLHGAGRTDSGVHALAQIAHFDLAKETDADTVRDALNHHLQTKAATVLQAEAVSEDFNARFSATGREYLYRILNRRAPTALERGRVWHVARPLDAAAMHTAAQHLVGHHDFSTFRALRCQAKSPVKTLDELAVSRVGDEIHIAAKARSFLHNQVRILAGTLKLVGEGAWSEAQVSAALEAKDRSAGGPTAPPEGLYLTRVRY
ncbi:MAG: tRNA pseudouridine(38-40) synthase TruA [Alphaproteobacteria bacterium]|nr:tRNA pseudouridine(38-40) synthase TruA [Alphaproteobacteria bacterium]